MFGRKKQKQQEVPETNIRTHESGYIMRTGEHMVLGQEATSPEGNGWLLATNKALLLHPWQPEGDIPLSGPRHDQVIEKREG